MGAHGEGRGYIQHLAERDSVMTRFEYLSCGSW
jgi:hypothetical protein